MQKISNTFSYQLSMHILIDDILVSYTSIPAASYAQKTFLWLHGRQQKGETFLSVIKQLPQYTHVIIDLPWFGNTLLPSSIWWISEYAEFVYKFINKLALPSDWFVIVWHSFWWRIALELLGKRLYTATNLILLWSAGIESVPKLSLQKKIITCVKKVFSFVRMHTIYEKIARIFRSTDYNNAWWLKDIFLKTVAYDQRYLLEKITVPTLLIRGKYDDQTPLEHAYIMQRMIPQNQLYITDGGHFTYQTHHEEIASEIHSFLTTYE